MPPQFTKGFSFNSYKDLANVHPEVADWASVEVENIPHSSVPFSLEFEVDFWEKYLSKTTRL